MRDLGLVQNGVSADKLWGGGKKCVCVRGGGGERAGEAGDQLKAISKLF